MASSVLHGLANAIETESTEPLSSCRSPRIEELHAKVLMEEAKSRDAKDLLKHAEMRLCASLLHLASGLERRTRSNFALQSSTAKGIEIWSVRTIAET